MRLSKTLPPPIIVICLVFGDCSCLAIQQLPKLQATKQVVSRKNGGISNTFFFYDHQGYDVRAVVFDDSNKNDRVPTSGNDNNNPLVQIQAGLRSTFLPAGYPSKTPPGYLTYSMWSWIQDFSTQLRGIVATQRVLEGVGVGRQGATALSAALNFIARDGAGMAANLLFTSVASSHFGTDVKRWRLFADIVNDVGITLEVASVFLPNRLFLPMICVGNMCKAMCGVAAGACGGSINLHWAKGSSIADINAKFGAQHTVTGSLGLIFAALFARSISLVSDSVLWTLYTSLTILHIYANMQCMKLIAFDHLNSIRMNLLLRQFFSAQDVELLNTRLLDPPAVVSRCEPLFFFVGAKRFLRIPIRLGVSFNTIANLSGKEGFELQSLLDDLPEKRYIVTIGKRRTRRYCVLVSLCQTAAPQDIAKAYLHAAVLGRILESKGITKLGITGKEEVRNIVHQAEKEANFEAESQWQLFEREAREVGWDLSKTDLTTEGFELEIS